MLARARRARTASSGSAPEREAMRQSSWFSEVLFVHKSLGVAALALVVLRIAVRLAAGAQQREAVHGRRRHEIAGHVIERLHRQRDRLVFFSTQSFTKPKHSLACPTAK